MKIPKSVREVYDAQRELAERLKKAVDAAFIPAKKEGWFYRARIKSEESFSQKLETGRVPNPTQLEDFFGCTLVVENSLGIQDALALVENLCDIHYRKPKQEDVTHLHPSCFEFTGLRLYVTLKYDDALPPKPIYDIMFEVQIKTFLQHAWGIVTHDLIYKADEVNWAKSRIAYQVKAMLEHAEISIEKADELSESVDLAKSNHNMKFLGDIIQYVEKEFPSDNRPRDLVRLAETVKDLLRALKLDLNDLSHIIQAETDAGRGTNTLNLSPYGIIVQSLLNQRADDLISYLRKNKDFKVFIPDEIEIPVAYEDVRFNNVIRPQDGGP